MEAAPRRHSRGRRPHADVLTPAEWRVLEEVRRGYTNAEIAERLGLSLNTVKTHVSSMLAKLGARDRRALAEWRGEPSSATRRVLARLRFAAPLGLPAGRGGAMAAIGKAVGIGALAVAAAGAVVAGAVLARGGNGGPIASPPTSTPTTLAAAPTSEPRRQPTSEPTPTVEPTPTAEPTSTATPGPPYRRVFAPGEPVDVSPAVLFIDPDTGETEAWVIPGAWPASGPEFGVAPSGTYVVYRVGQDGPFRLLRFDDGSDREIRADSLPIEFGPGDAGFVATTQDRFVVSYFDGFGEHTGELWLGGISGREGVAWSPDGEAIATSIYPGGGAVLNLTIRIPLVPAQFEDDAGISSGRPFLEWSYDSRRLALVTEDRVRVFTREGDLLWEQEGEFYGNPRWSPDDRHVYVNSMPSSGGEYAYLFSAEGEPLFRFFTPEYAGGCGGDPWVDADTFEFGDHDVRLDGTLEEHGRPSQTLEELMASHGVTLDVDGAGFHVPHYGGTDYFYELPDGRLVMTVTGAGHGGCGEQWTGRPGLPDAHIERPPW